jgi:hypothetical protein
LQALAEGRATQADLARRFHLGQSTISRLAEKAPPPPAPMTIRSALDAETERAARNPALIANIKREGLRL